MATYQTQTKKKRPEEQALAGVVQQATPPATSQSASLGQQTATQGSLVQPRQIDPEVMNLFKSLQQRVNAAPITADDVMRTDEYKDMAKALDFQADQAQAANRRNLASRGMLRSTPAVQAISNTDSYYTAQKQALVPQLIQNAYNRRQQEITNAGTLLSSLAGLQDTAFNQGLSEFQTTAPYTQETTGQKIQQEQFNKTFPLDEAAVTGRYMNQDVRDLLNRLVAAKNSYANPNDGTTPEQDNAIATQARQTLQARGYDVSGIGADSTLAQTLANIGAGGFSMPTIQSRQAEANYLGTYNGQPTIQGKQANQDLQMGELQYNVSANPEYGLAAQAQQAIQQGNLNMENTRSIMSARSAAEARAAQQAAQPELNRTNVAQQLGVDPGLTTNYDLFAQTVDDINLGALQGGTYSQFETMMADDNYENELRAMGVDTSALRNYARRVLMTQNEQAAQVTTPARGGARVLRD